MVTGPLTQLPRRWGAAPDTDFSPQHGCQQLVAEVDGPAQLGPQGHLGGDSVQRGCGEQEVPPPGLSRPTGQQTVVAATSESGHGQWEWSGATSGSGHEQWEWTRATSGCGQG